MVEALATLVVILVLIIIGGCLAADEEAVKEAAEREAALPALSLLYEGPCPLCYRQIRVGDIVPPEVP